MSDASFDRVISEHLALTRRNRRLERQMPLDSYRDHVDGESAEVKPAANAEQEHWLDTESFWDSSGERPLPEFDWGDD
jgi:hypothetical protein